MGSVDIPKEAREKLKKQVTKPPVDDAFNSAFDQAVNGKQKPVVTTATTTTKQQPAVNDFNSIFDQALKKKETSGSGLPTGSEPTLPSTLPAGQSNTKGESIFTQEDIDRANELYNTNSRYKYLKNKVFDYGAGTPSEIKEFNEFRKNNNLSMFSQPIDEKGSPDYESNLKAYTKEYGPPETPVDKNAVLNWINNKFPKPTLTPTQAEEKKKQKLAAIQEAVNKTPPIQAVQKKPVPTKKDIEEQAANNIVEGRSGFNPQSEDPLGDMMKKKNADLNEKSIDDFFEGKWKEHSDDDVVKNQEIDFVKDLLYNNGDEAGVTLQEYANKKNGGDISKLSDDEVMKLAEGNETMKVAAEKYTNLRDLQTTIAGARNFDDAATTYMQNRYDKELGGQIKYLRKEGGGTNVLLNEPLKGQIMFDFLSDKNLQYLKDKDPKVNAEYTKALYNFPNQYPDQAEKLLSEMIADEREKTGMNNFFANVVGKESTDKIVDDLIARGDLPPNYKAIYTERIRPSLGTGNAIGRGIGNLIPGLQQFVNDSKIPTPGFAENVEVGYENTLTGTAKSIATLSGARGVYSNESDRINSALEKQLTTRAFEPQGLGHAASMVGGHFTGFMLGLSPGSTALKGIGLLKNVQAANAMAMGAAVYGDFADRAKQMFPGQPVKQYLYTDVMTALNVAGAKYLPGTQINKMLQKTEGAIMETIDKAAGSKISTDFAISKIKDRAMPIILEAIKKTTKGNLGAGEFMAANTFIDQTLSQALKGEHLQLANNSKEAAKQFGLGFLGATFISAAGAGLDARAEFRGVRNQIYDIASNPKDYRDALDIAAQLDPSVLKAKPDILDNLNIISTVKKELDSETNLSDGQKKSYVVKSLQEHALEKKIAEITEPELKKPLQERLKEIKKAKAKILEPAGEIDDQYKQRIAMAKTEAEKESIMQEHADILTAQTQMSEGDKLRIQANELQMQANMLPPEEMEKKNQMWADADKLRRQADETGLTPEDKDLLSRVREKANFKDMGLQYYIDKAGEDPTQAAKDYGQDVADELLKKVPTETLQANLEKSINLGATDSADAISKEIDRREAAAKGAQPSIEDMQQLRDVHKNLAAQYLQRHNELVKEGLRDDELNNHPDLVDIKSQMEKIETAFQNDFKQPIESKTEPTVSEVGDGGEKKSGVSVIMPSENKSNVIPLKKAESETTQTTPEGTEQIPTEEGGGTEEPVDENVPAAEDKPPISDQPQGTTIHFEHPQTELSMRGLQVLANEFGFDNVESRDKKSDLELMRDAEQTVNDWAANGVYAKNIEELVRRSENNGTLNDEERVILEQHVANLAQKLRGLKSTRDPQYDEVLAEAKRVKDAGEKARQAAGAALRIPIYRARPRNILDAFVEEMEATKQNKLTDEQKENVKKEWEDLEKAKEDFEKYKADREREMATKQAASAFENLRKTTPREKKSHDDFVAERSKHVDNIKDKLKKFKMGGGPLSAVPLPYIPQLIAIAPDVAKIMLSYVKEEGATFLDFVEDMHSMLKPEIKGITHDDIIAMAAGRYNEKKETNNALREKLYDWRKEARWLDKLIQVKGGEIPMTEKKERRYNKRLAELEKEYKNNPLVQADKEAKRIQDRIDVLKQRKADLDDGKIPAKREKKKAEINEEIKQLEEEIKEHPTLKKAENDEKIKKAKEQLADLDEGIEPKKADRKKKEVSEELAALQKQLREHDVTRLANAKASMQKRIDKIEAELDARKKGTYQEPKKLPKPPLDKVGQDLRDKLMKLENERELRLLIEAHKSMSGVKRALNYTYDILNIPRSLMTIDDYSAMMRQGLIPTIAHPGMAFGVHRGADGKLKWDGAFYRMFKAGVSQKAYDRWFHELRGEPRYDMMRDTRLAISDNISHELTAREEQMMSTLVEKFPIIGQTLNIKVGGKNIKIPGTNLVKGSERAYTMYLNKMRVDLFNMYSDLMESNGKTYRNAPEQYREMAKYVNNLTGRGDFVNMGEFGPLVNGAFFSPKLIYARINMLTYLAQPRFYKKVPGEIRKAYFADMAKFITAGVMTLGLMKLWGNDVESDPRSTDFGKIKSGNTRWDIWGGFQPYARAASQVMSGERKKANGEIVDLGNDKPFQLSEGDIVLGLLRSKVSPILGAVIDIKSGETMIGDKIIYHGEAGDKEISIKDYIIEHMIPLTVSGTLESMKDQGAKAVATVGIPNLFGIGTQTYSSASKPRERRNSISTHKQ